MSHTLNSTRPMHVPSWWKRPATFQQRSEKKVEHDLRVPFGRIAGNIAPIPRGEVYTSALCVFLVCVCVCELDSKANLRMQHSSANSAVYDSKILKTGLLCINKYLLAWMECPESKRWVHSGKTKSNALCSLVSPCDWNMQVSLVEQTVLCRNLTWSLQLSWKKTTNSKVKKNRSFLPSKLSGRHPRVRSANNSSELWRCGGQLLSLPTSHRPSSIKQRYMWCIYTG